MLNLLFHIPLLWAVLITGFHVLLLLGLRAASDENHRGHRARARGHYLSLLLH